MDAKSRYIMNAISPMPRLSRKMSMTQELSYGCFLREMQSPGGKDEKKKVEEIYNPELTRTKEVTNLEEPEVLSERKLQK